MEASDFGEFFTTKPFLDGLFKTEPGEAGGTSNWNKKKIYVKNLNKEHEQFLWILFTSYKQFKCKL